jgi:probable F420-dependent oxidoreductase
MEIATVLPFAFVKPDEKIAENIAKFSVLLEKVGFNAVSVTDHPVPTGRWLDAGGHFAHDPFIELSFVAAATRTLKLQTGILVLPYRNPFITARAIATLDVLSNGRVILGVGAGYLKGEYKALGVDFDRRNEIMDEYLKALKTAWTADEFTFEGTGYQALGNRILPRTVQKPHPPLWIGGNSKRAIRRAAELGDAWYPFFTQGALSKTSRTAALTDEVGLGEGIKYLHDHCEAIGRNQLPQIFVGGIQPEGEWNAQVILDTLGTFAELGVTGAGVPLKGSSPAEWHDSAERYGSEVIPKLPKSRSAA